MTEINIPSLTELSGIHIIYRGSASAETPDRRGVSHLLEHLICNRMTDLMERSQKDAVSINAGTSNRYISFDLTGLEEYVEKYREEFLRAVTGHITFTQEELEQERAVVLQELSMRDANLLSKSYFAFMRHVWDFWGAGGDPEVIRTITLAEVQDYYDRQYHEPQMIISIRPGCERSHSEFCSEGYELPCLIDLHKRNTEPVGPLPDPNVYIAAGPAIPLEELPYSQMISQMLCGSLEKPLIKRLRKELQLCYDLSIDQTDMGGYYSDVLFLHAPAEQFERITRETADILEKGEFLTREEFDETLRMGRIQLRIGEPNRYRNVYNIHERTIYSPGVMDTLTYEGLLRHYDRYFRPFLTSFLFSTPLPSEEEKLRDYSVESLIRRVEAGEQPEYIFFWSHHERRPDVVTRACLSQWYPSEFEIDGIRYSCAEQYMMAEKARMMGNEEMLRMIMATSDPREMKALGRAIPNFDHAHWDRIKLDTVRRGNIAKFSQNPKLLDYLRWTGDRILVEASPYDKVWGIGLRSCDERTLSPATWLGTNFLGIALMQTRDLLCGRKTAEE